MNLTKQTTNVDRQVDRPLRTAAGITTEVKSLTHRAKAQVTKVSASCMQDLQVLHQGVVSNQDAASSIIQSSAKSSVIASIHIGVNHVGIGFGGLGLLDRGL